MKRRFHTCGGCRAGSQLGKTRTSMWICCKQESSTAKCIPHAPSSAFSLLHHPPPEHPDNLLLHCSRERSKLQRKSGLNCADIFQSLCLKIAYEACSKRWPGSDTFTKGKCPEHSDEGLAPIEPAWGRTWGITSSVLVYMTPLFHLEIFVFYTFHVHHVLETLSTRPLTGCDAPDIFLLYFHYGLTRTFSWH